MNHSLFAAMGLQLKYKREKGGWLNLVKKMAVFSTSDTANISYSLHSGRFLKFPHLPKALKCWGSNQDVQKELGKVMSDRKMGTLLYMEVNWIDPRAIRYQVSGWLRLRVERGESELLKPKGDTHILWIEFFLGTVKLKPKLLSSSQMNFTYSCSQKED